MDADAMRRRLENISRATASSTRLEPAGFWVGDKAGERRTWDDFGAGRLAWRGAHRATQAGLKALDDGDLEMAEICVWQATDLFVDALWSRMEPADIEFLSNSAGRRGRPSKHSERDAALSEAVSLQESKGLKGKAARRAALDGDPSLAEAFAGKTDAALVKAIQRHAKGRE